MNPPKRPYQLWYWRRGKMVRGPFPAEQVSSYVLLGRYRLDDEISQDRAVWSPIADHPHLIPEVMQRVGTAAHRERLELARRHVDERLAERRHPGSAHKYANRRLGDRREPESEEVKQRRAVLADELAQEREAGRRLARPAYLAGALIVAAVVAWFAALRLFPSPEPQGAGAPDCAASAAPGVNWNNCQRARASLARADLAGARASNADLSQADLRGARLAGADLSYSDLSGAVLRGADLHRANLKGAVLRGTQLVAADLREADLSYSDLSGADLARAVLTDTRLGKTIWTDGHVCADDSVGVCR